MTPWSPDYISIPTIGLSSDLEVSLNATDDEILLIWRDNADNEICIAAVKISPPEGVSASLAIIGPTDTTDTEGRSFPVQGVYRYQVFAGDADGLSALSNKACVEVPVRFVMVAAGSGGRGLWRCRGPGMAGTTDESLVGFCGAVIAGLPGET